MQTTRSANFLRRPACKTALLAVLVPFVSVSAAVPQRGVPMAPKGPALFAQNCAACHGSDGRGGERAPNIATRQDVVSMPDGRLRSIISNGIPSAGMPAFGVLGDKQVGSIVAYLRILQGMTSGVQTHLPGDPRAGEKLFFATDSCARCHAMNGRGGFMASDLSSFARDHSVAFVENAIVHPPEDAGEKDHAVTIETDRGATLTGLVRARSNFMVVLQTEDGVFHSVPHDTIRRETMAPNPYMPEYKTLSKEQLDNLASYLLQRAVSPAMPRVIPPAEASR